jgi:hypothetical protein
MFLYNIKTITMKKKNAFNIMLFVFIIDLFLIFSCAKDIKKSTAGVLIKTDREFSDLSAKNGMNKAFLEFVAENGVLLRNNSFPVSGRKSISDLFLKGSDTSFVLIWEPLFEKISETGDLGYTYGVYKSIERTTGKIQKGTYITIWEKQKDGSYKFVIDSGTNGLPE